MKFLNYFLFIYFIKLCNSFTLINQKYPNFISRDKLNKINSGCDYYIDKDLNIYDNNDKIFSYINLDRKKGYYQFVSVLDEDENETELEEYIKNKLEPSMKTIIIYSNNSFHNLSFEDKYKRIIENELNLFNKTFNDVSKIIKEEIRYKDNYFSKNF